jgi:hypothetical protein
VSEDSLAQPAPQTACSTNRSQESSQMFS